MDVFIKDIYYFSRETTTAELRLLQAEVREPTHLRMVWQRLHPPAKLARKKPFSADSVACLLPKSKLVTRVFPWFNSILTPNLFRLVHAQIDSLEKPGWKNECYSVDLRGGIHVAKWGSEDVISRRGVLNINRPTHLAISTVFSAISAAPTAVSSTSPYSEFHILFPTWCTPVCHSTNSVCNGWESIGVEKVATGKKNLETIEDAPRPGGNLSVFVSLTPHS